MIRGASKGEVKPPYTIPLACRAAIINRHPPIHSEDDGIIRSNLSAWFEDFGNGEWARISQHQTPAGAWADADKLYTRRANCAGE